MARETPQDAPFDTEYFQDYYKGYRNHIGDLFDSERRFLDRFCQQGRSYLDVGCALGGMSQILGKLGGRITYTGVDVSRKMIQGARRKHPEFEFDVVDGVELGYPDSSFDRVVSLGTTVHDQEWKRLLSELWRVAREAVLFDIRLTPELPTVASLAEGFVLDGSGMRYPYVVANWHDFREVIGTLTPAPAIVAGYGYWGRANESTTLPPRYERLCMACFYLEKQSDTGNAACEMELELPFC